MASLGEVCTPRPSGDRYQLAVPDGWRMGRGAFGGFVVAALIRAVEHHVADPARKVRSVTAELPGPVEPGAGERAAEIAVETLRRGNNVSTVRAALSQHGEIKSHAVVVVAAARTAGGTAPPVTWNDLTPPAAPAWTEIAPLPAAHGLGPLPEFAQHFEYRVVEGLPGGGGSPRTLGWLRARDPGAQRDAGYLAAMIDAWWPVAFVRLGAIRPMATLTFTLDIAGGVDDLDPAAPLLYRATAPVCTDGYALETRELWSPDGRLVAINHQTFVIIR
jgi:hypothetical protein